MFVRFFTFIVLCISTSIFAQIELTGRITDKNKEILPYANVIATVVGQTPKTSFVISDENGYYNISLAKNKTYKISVSYMGFDSAVYTLKATTNTTKNFTLIESQNQLEEVVIEMPVTIKEDTITYNTDKFTNGKERKLKNILSKLPGMEVSKDGTVRVMGKKVTKLLVDNKPFFGGNTKLGVENIPADVVSKVEAIDNYNSIGFLKGLSESNKMALNISLKKGKKRFVFGDIEAAKGNKKYYKASSSLFYYSPKTTINSIGNLNNFGEKSLSFSDFRYFRSKINSIFDNEINYRSSGIGQFLISKDVVKTNHKFGSFSIRTPVSPKTILTAYGIFSKNSDEEFKTDENQYPDFLEQRTSNQKNNYTVGIGNLRLEYSPNYRERLHSNTQLKRNQNNIYKLLDTRINTLPNNFETTNTNTAKYINQNIEWHKKLSRKHTLSTLLDYQYNDDFSNTLWQNSKPSIQNLIPIDTTQNTFKIEQLSKLKEHSFNAVFKHFWSINRKNHIYSTLGIKNNNDLYGTDTYQILDNNSKHNFKSKGFGNNTKHNFNELYAKVNYKFLVGIFSFNQGIALHKYSWEVLQEQQYKNSKWYPLPNFELKVKFNSSHKLNFKYNIRTNFGYTTSLANRFVLNSYNSILKGNEKLDNGLKHEAVIHYNRFSLRKISISATAKYSKNITDIRRTINFKQTNSFYTYENIHNPEESFFVRSRLSKRTKKLKYGLNLDYTRNSFLQKINSTTVTNLSENINYEINVTTLYDKFPTIKAGFKSSIGNYRSSNSISKFISYEPYTYITYDIDDFKIKLDYTYYKYHNEKRKQNNSYELANASLLYHKENSPYTFKIVAQNLLNMKFKQQNRFSNYLINNKKMYVMPRVLLFSISYKI